MTRKISLGPLNRVEGDLDIQLSLDENEDTIESAQVKSTLYRGFENLLTGKSVMDALTITPRVCGICSISQSVAAAKAIADFAKTPMAANGQRVTNILLASEIVADILTHFYLFFMPDFTHSAYRNMSWSDDVNTNFTAVSGKQHGIMLKARAEFLHIMGILAGKWPHSMVFQPGGVSKVVSMSEQMKLLGIIANFKLYLEQVVFGEELESIANLQSQAELESWQENHPFNHSDLSVFLGVSHSLNLSDYGKSSRQFLAFPAFEQENNRYYQGGVFLDNQVQLLATTNIVEHHNFAKLHGEQFSPVNGFTQPDINKTDAYTWCKAPRYNNRVMETGSLARQFINGDSLAQSLVGSSGANIHNRMVLRLVELAKLTLQIERWIKDIEPQNTFCHQLELPKEGQGIGLSEAARGSLGHWMTVEKGKISNYQLVAPTSWNFSPRDNQGVPGVLEQSLAKLPYQNAQEKQMLQHIIRSFDPCMLCTVH